MTRNRNRYLHFLPEIDRPGSPCGFRTRESRISREVFVTHHFAWDVTCPTCRHYIYRYRPDLRRRGFSAL